MRVCSRNKPEMLKDKVLDNFHYLHHVRYTHQTIFWQLEHQLGHFAPYFHYSESNFPCDCSTYYLQNVMRLCYQSVNPLQNQSPLCPIGWQFFLKRINPFESDPTLVCVSWDKNQPLLLNSFLTFLYFGQLYTHIIFYNI